MRPIHLSRDFRNTRQIHDAAWSLMDFDDSPGDETGKADQYRPHGSKPELVFCDSEDPQLQKIHNRVRTLQEQHPGESIAVAFPRRKSTRDCSALDGATVTTLHLLKGPEADHVILASLDSDELNFNNEYTQEDTDRNLLYVGMTRAKKSLTMMCASERPAWVLSELGPELLDIDASENPQARLSLLSILEERKASARRQFEDVVHQTVEKEEQAERVRGEGSDSSDAVDDAIGLIGAEDHEADQTDKSAEDLERELAKLREKLARSEDQVRAYRAREEASRALAEGTEQDNPERKHEFYDDAKVLILGISKGIKPKDIAGIFKSTGLPRDAFECCSYDDIHGGKFQADKLLGTMCYSDIFIGTSPHKAQGIGDSSSLIEYLQQNEPDLPKLTVFRASDGKPKAMSKTDLKEALYKSALYAAKHEM